MARVLLIGAPAGDDIPPALLADGHDLTFAGNLEEADLELETTTFDTVLLLGFGSEGRSWCVRSRVDGWQWPILVVTDDATAWTRISSLDCGADDVVVRPIIMAELRARVRALSRRGPLLRRNEVIRGDTRLDFTARRAWIGEREISLTPGEWKIVDYLEMNAGRVAAHDDILEALYGEAAWTRRASLEVLIGRIRKKLGTTFIRTVRGRGYAVG